MGAKRQSELRIPNPNSHGFTLLEVMVAVSIMATVLVTLLGLQNRTMQDVALAEHITTATMLAKRMMVEASGPDRLPVEEDGDFTDEENLKTTPGRRPFHRSPFLARCLSPRSVLRSCGRRVRARRWWNWWTMNSIAECGVRSAECGKQGLIRYSNPKSEIRNPKSGGFTLLEVLIAVAIMAGIVTVIYTSFSTASRNVEQAEARRDAETWPVPC